MTKPDEKPTGGKPPAPPGKPDHPQGGPPGQDKPKPKDPVVDNSLPDDPSEGKPEEVPIDPATGEQFKAGEVVPGCNTPVGGEFTGKFGERLERDAEDAEEAQKESEERAEAERKRLADADAKRAKEEARPAKK